MSTIFISYRHGDETERDETIKLLKGKDYRTWFDDDIRGGEAWRKVIETELEGATACVVVVTPNIFESKWVLFEVGFALGFGIEVIPWCPKPVHPSNRSKGKELYDLLNEIQFVETENDLAEKLKEANENHIAEYLNIEIAQMTLRFRVLAHIGCAYLTKSNLKSESEQNDLIQRAQKCFQELSYIWVELDWKSFWLENSSSFNRKQKRIYNKLIDLFIELRPKLGSVQDELRNIENGYGRLKELQHANNELQENLQKLDNYMDNNIYKQVRYNYFLERLNNFVTDKEYSASPIFFSNLGLEIYDKHFIPSSLKIWFDPQDSEYFYEIKQFLYRFRTSVSILLVYIKYGKKFTSNGRDVFNKLKSSIMSVDKKHMEEFRLKPSSIFSDYEKKHLEAIQVKINQFIIRYVGHLEVRVDEKILSYESNPRRFDSLKDEFENINEYIDKYFGVDETYQIRLEEILQLEEEIFKHRFDKAESILQLLLTEINSD